MRTGGFYRKPAKIIRIAWTTRNVTGGEILEHPGGKPEAGFKVLLLNDDYTHNFVVEILEQFLKQPAEAYRIMMAVHAGRDVRRAESGQKKVATVIDLARARTFPLLAAMERIKGKRERHNGMFIRVETC